MRGDIGEKQRSATTRQELARIETETVQLENKRRADMADSAATLRVKQASAEQVAKLAEIEARQTTSVRDTEAETLVNQKKAQLEVEKLRTVQLAQAQVQAEAKVREAQGEAEAQMKAADAKLYKEMREADAIKARYEATSAGLFKMKEAVGGTPDAFLQFLMIDRQVYTQLAEKNAAAVAGMQPKITVWTTGPSGGGGGGAGGGSNPMGASTPAGAAIADVYRMLPPLASTIAEQTGIRPPSWLVNLPEAGPAGAAGAGAAGKVVEAAAAEVAVPAAATAAAGGARQLK